MIGATVATSMANPSIGFDGTNYFVVWGDNPVICGQFASPTGALVGSKITIAPSGTYPEVVFDGYSYLVVWRLSTAAVYGQRVATSGALVGSSFMVSDNTADWKLQIAAAAGIDNYLVVWAERHVDYDIFGNVDVNVIGIEENRTAQFGKSWNSTILSGPLQLPKGRACRVFDIAGRVVMPEKMKPGVYFIEIDGKITQKVVKAR
jgi:hypothetical protein